ncbi:MAG: imidazole glycerol phosphate synthase subunit HisH [Polyangiaceae bacterium]
MIGRVSIVDTGAGNLHSLGKALARLLPDATVEIVTGAPPRDALLVLPGVGAFGAAAERLAPARAELRAAIRDGQPAIGICLGMQLLFESSEEGPGEGLGVIEGRVTRLRTPRLPHMGWSRVRADAPWLAAAMPDALYFAHSFACRPTDPGSVLATAEVPGDAFPVIVRTANAIGCQFHPEKSSAPGLALLGRLVREVTA